MSISDMYADNKEKVAIAIKNRLPVESVNSLGHESVWMC